MKRPSLPAAAPAAPTTLAPDPGSPLPELLAAMASPEEIWALWATPTWLQAIAARLVRDCVFPFAADDDAPACPPGRWIRLAAESPATFVFRADAGRAVLAAGPELPALLEVVRRGLEDAQLENSVHWLSTAGVFGDDEAERLLLALRPSSWADRTAVLGAIHRRVGVRAASGLLIRWLSAHPIDAAEAERLSPLLRRGSTAGAVAAWATRRAPGAHVRPLQDVLARLGDEELARLAAGATGPLPAAIRAAAFTALIPRSGAEPLAAAACALLEPGVAELVTDQLPAMLQRHGRAGVAAILPLALRLRGQEALAASASLALVRHSTEALEALLALADGPPIPWEPLAVDALCAQLRVGLDAATRDRLLSAARDNPSPLVRRVLTALDSAID